MIVDEIIFDLVAVGVMKLPIGNGSIREGNEVRTAHIFSLDSKTSESLDWRLFTSIAAGASIPHFSGVGSDLVPATIAM